MYNVFTSSVVGLRLLPAAVFIYCQETRRGGANARPDVAFFFYAVKLRSFSSCSKRETVPLEQLEIIREQRPKPLHAARLVPRNRRLRDAETRPIMVKLVEPALKAAMNTVININGIRNFGVKYGLSSNPPP